MGTLVVQKTAPAPLKSKLVAWLPTVGWLVAIAFFSTDTFSAEHTGRILEKIINAIYGQISPAHFQMIHVIVRKGAHFSVYGLLSLFAFYSWRLTLPRPARWTFTWSLLALLLTLFAAGSDEFHQVFVASRGPSLNDVLLDMMGAIFVQLLLASFTRLRPAAD